MKTAPTNKKIRELITMVKDGKLIPRPEFQRRLVWTRADKNLFLDSILRHYPFPEIYLADGDVNLDTGAGTQILVDGLQRVSTIIEYFDGDEKLSLTSVPAYKALSETEKKGFLLYDVAVRDIGGVGRDEIIEVFKRINATKYSLLDIEVSNAVYKGALKQFSEKTAEDPFFVENGVFTNQDIKRMGDLKYALTIIITIMQGYFNRDEAFGDMLARFNDEFPSEAEIAGRIKATFDFIIECGFPGKSRAWKKADLFTLIVELDACLFTKKLNLQPGNVVEALNGFYDKLSDSTVTGTDIYGIYYKAAIQASNDKGNRIRRGVIIGKLLEGVNAGEIVAEMNQMSFL